MAVKWSLKENSVEVRSSTGAKDFKIGKFSAREFDDFSEILDLERNVWTILKQAMQNIMTGRAEYAGAYQKTKALVSEIDLAFASSVKVAYGIFAFFEDAEGITKEIVDPKEILNFSAWCIENLKGFAVA